MINRFLILLMLCITLLITSCNGSDNNFNADGPRTGGINNDDLCQVSANLKSALSVSNDIDFNEALVESFYRYYTERHVGEGPFHNQELEFLPSFGLGATPDWNQLSRFIAVVAPATAWMEIINDDDCVDRYLPMDTFDDIAQRYFSSLNYEHRDSDYLRLVNDGYIPTGWSFNDFTYYRLNRISKNPDDSFNAGFDGFTFWPADVFYPYSDAIYHMDSMSENMKALLNYAGTETEMTREELVLEIFLRDDYRDILTVNETMEVSFSVSNNPECAFVYMSSQRLPEKLDPF
ncbi:MAG: hypothetical protein Q4B48_00995 [Syntrophomonadaceae bacterium]|nr:hypothetical protein [Syntrophomonadaceae bacterium]